MKEFNADEAAHIAELIGDMPGTNVSEDMSWATQQLPVYPSPVYPGTEPGGLMESLAIGTGFDIAMVQQDLAPPATDIDTTSQLADQSASYQTEPCPTIDTLDAAQSAAYATNTEYSTYLDALLTHHQNY